MASTSKHGDGDGNFLFSDDDSEDITYQMSVETSDSDSNLDDYVDHATEETVQAVNEHDDPFLYVLCEPQMLVNEIDDNEEVHEAVNVDDNVSNIDDNADVENSYLVHDPKQKWKLMKPSLGEKYENPTQLKFCITNYAIANGFQLRFDKYDSKRVVVRCGLRSDSENQCPFRLYASWMNKERSFQVKILDENHICPRNYAHNSLAKPNWIAQTLMPHLIKNQDMTLKQMKQQIFEKYLCNVSLGQCHRAKLRAIHKIEGSLVDHYGRVWDANNQVYPICKGELLTAIGRDANNQVYPIAWAVYDIENKENWTQFLNLLGNDLQLSEGVGLTLLSDQHKGLIEAVKDILPQAEHRQCARHVYANFKKKFNGLEYKRLFWGAAMSHVVADFENQMLELKAISEDAYNHLIERDPTSWCRAFFEKNRACEAVENGICESFNKMILDARKKPVITLLESIRLLVMQRMHNMVNMADQLENDVCPAILKKLKLFSRNYRSWSVIPSGGHMFEARKGADAFSIDLENQSCSCTLWQLAGIPCVHGVASILSINRRLEDYVSGWFRKAKFQAAYSTSIQPLNGSKLWAKSPHLKPLPPKERRMPGRPVLKRKKHPSEKEERPSKRTHEESTFLDGKGSRSMTCSKCQQKGHNQRKCTNEIVNPPVKVAKPRGRPKINIGVPQSSCG